MQSPRSPSRARPSLSARPAVACGCAGRCSPAGARRVASTRPSPACAPACAGRAWPGSAGPTARCTAGFGRGGLLTCARPSRTVRASARRLGGRARDVKPDLLGKQLHSFSNNLKHTLSTSNKIVSNVRLVTCAARIPALRPCPVRRASQTLFFTRWPSVRHRRRLCGRSLLRYPLLAPSRPRLTPRRACGRPRPLQTRGRARRASRARRVALGLALPTRERRRPRRRAAVRRRQRRWRVARPR